MSTPAASPELNVPPPQPSPFARMINVFIAPGKAFDGMNRGRTGWWMPWLISVIVSLAFAVAVGKQVGWDQLAQNQIHHNQKLADQLEKTPPEQREKTTGFIAASFKYTFYATPVLSLIFTAIIAGVFLATFNFGFGASIRFGTMFAIIVYGFLPYVLHGLISIATLFAGVDPEGFRVESPAATNLGALLSTDASPALFRITSAVDIFNIWIIVLLGIGIAANSKIKRSTAIATVAGWYVLVIGVQTLIAFARG